MYRVLVVDDEPAALKNIGLIISMKCPGFTVAGTSENGRQALDFLSGSPVDVVITDVKMPEMDGIELITEVSRMYPQIMSLVISGYQEFEYAKAAIQTGVCDYLLKPVKPSTLRKALDRVEVRLDEIYSRQRNAIIKQLYQGVDISGAVLKRYFPARHYYAAVCRKNGLPRRFSKAMGVEIFSGRDEKVYIYGRDEMESLYLCPEELMIYPTFRDMVTKIESKDTGDADYTTTVVRPEPFAIEECLKVFNELYSILDNHIVIGQSQTLVTDEEENVYPPDDPAEAEAFQNLEYYMRQKQQNQLRKEVIRLFTLWQGQSRSQMYVETKVRYIILLLDKYHLLPEQEESTAYILDEIFYYAADMPDAAELINASFIQPIKEDQNQRKLDTPEFFKQIEDYIHEHLDEPISLKFLCHTFGISQTYISQMFRKYTNYSFNKYLTLTRIGQAKKLMADGEAKYVKDIAQKVGYNDQFYFSRIFTSVAGVSPSDYMAGMMHKADQ